MTLQVSIKAMRDDAALWAGVASVTDQAASAAAGFALSTRELSWASEETGLNASYEEIRAKTERLLHEATTTLNDLSGTLTYVAGEYERSDAEASAKFKGVWDPHR